jgi:acyl-CoA synthetase (NDP forming)
MAGSSTLDLLFSPSSIAIVGDRRENNFYWAHAIHKADFKGLVYYVNTAVERAMGQKFYKSLKEIPLPVDYVIVSVPAKLVPSIISDCAEKGVKFASIFSSGFSETGSEAGKILEEKIRKAASGKVRVIGPNCMGVYCPRGGLAFRLDQPKTPGSVAFISQSGGLSINFTLSGWRHGIRFSKVVSYGNAVDIGDAELLDYLADDPETTIIGAYLEGTKDGQRLVNALRNASSKKPVIVWKGGRTGSGAKAVASHTGSLAGSPYIWEAVMHQTKVIQVNSFEELVGTTKVFYFAPPTRGNAVGLVSISGGSSVVNTDTVTQSGLEVPSLTEVTKNSLKPIVQAVGTSVSNPMDLAGSFYNLDVLGTVILRMGEDQNIHSLIIEVAPLYPVPYSKHVRDYEMPSSMWRTILESSKQVKTKLGKPVLVTLVDIAYEKESRRVERKFTSNSIPCYQSVGEAARALSNFVRYHETR